MNRSRFGVHRDMRYADDGDMATVTLTDRIAGLRHCFIFAPDGSFVDSLPQFGLRASISDFIDGDFSGEAQDCWEDD